MPLPHTLHVGFAKCGSTFLQAYWRQHPEVHLVFKSLFFTPDNDQFAKGADGYRAHFAKAKPSQHRIESDEHLLMAVKHPRLGVHGLTDSSVHSVCERISQITPNARILLVIRNQVDLMISTYSQYLLGGGTLTLDDFANEMLRCNSDGVNYFHFHYDQIVETLESYFPNRIKVVLSEEMSENAPTRLASICEFMGIANIPFKSTFKDRRVGLARIGIPLVLALNRFVVRRGDEGRYHPSMRISSQTHKRICNLARVFEHYCAKPIAKTERYELASSHLLTSIRSEFAASNSRLSEVLGISLQRSYFIQERKPASRTDDVKASTELSSATA